jgi:glycosyltransferase involved in cell wall biosynthesis
MSAPVKHFIVTPTKNRLPLLKRAIESVAAQAGSVWRLVVVNDGSTDGTKEYLDELAAHDSRITVIHHEESRGVNAARNAAFKLLVGDELVSFLDDDDYFVPNAFTIMTDAFHSVPLSISVVFFNTYNVMPERTFEQGFRFDAGQTFCDPSYLEMMTKARMTGDCHPVFRAELFFGARAYRYPEDINGFESELLMRMVRDGVGVRYVPAIVACIDHAHESPHLSDYAARNNRASFVRAHMRIFRDHRDFFAAHPRLAMRNAINSCKNALRAYDIPHAAAFVGYWLQGLWRLVLLRRPQEKD